MLPSRMSAFVRSAMVLVAPLTTVSLTHDIVPGPNPHAIAALPMAYWKARLASVVTWGFNSSAVMLHGSAYSHIDALSHSA